MDRVWRGTRTRIKTARLASLAMTTFDVSISVLIRLLDAIPELQLSWRRLWTIRRMSVNARRFLHKLPFN